MPEAGQTWAKHHPPHLVVDVVDEDHPRQVAPHRGEEGHAVPHLDDRVPRADPTSESLQGGSREDRVATGAASSGVAVAVNDPGAAVDARRPKGDVHPGAGPAGQDSVGVVLRTPGLGVVDVPPCEHVNDARPAGLHGAPEGFGLRSGAGRVGSLLGSGLPRVVPGHCGHCPPCTLGATAT